MQFSAVAIAKLEFCNCLYEYKFFIANGKIPKMRKLLSQNTPEFAEKNLIYRTKNGIVLILQPEKVRQRKVSNTVGMLEKQRQGQKALEENILSNCRSCNCRKRAKQEPCCFKRVKNQIRGGGCFINFRLVFSGA